MATIDNTPNQTEYFPNIRVGCTDIFKSMWKHYIYSVPLDAFMYKCAAKAYTLYEEGKLYSVTPKPIIYVQLEEDYSARGSGRAFMFSIRIACTDLGYFELISIDEMEGRYDRNFETMLLDRAFEIFKSQLIYSVVHDKLNPKQPLIDHLTILKFAKLIIWLAVAFIFICAVLSYFSFISF